VTNVQVLYGGPVCNIDVELQIDWPRLGKILGFKAFGNTRKTSRTMKGAIIARARELK
jgi:hypothetical protein